jgi:hypothetical protein
MIGQLIFHSVYTCPQKPSNFAELLDIAFLWLLTSLSCHDIITRFGGEKPVVNIIISRSVFYSAFFKESSLGGGGQEKKAERKI